MHCGSVPDAWCRVGEEGSDGGEEGEGHIWEFE